MGSAVFAEMNVQYGPLIEYAFLKNSPILNLGFTNRVIFNKNYAFGVEIKNGISNSKFNYYREVGLYSEYFLYSNKILFPSLKFGIYTASTDIIQSEDITRGFFPEININYKISDKIRVKTGIGNKFTNKSDLSGLTVILSLFYQPH